jgi:hypothetical protein
MAPLPPAVFSMSSGSVMFSPSMHLRQLSKPTPRSASSPTWPPWTMIPLAPIAVARSICFCSSWRLGMRTRLFVVATLSTYGAWMYRSIPAAAASLLSASGPASYPTVGVFHPCGLPRKNWDRLAPSAVAAARGSSWSTWAPKLTVMALSVRRGADGVGLAILVSIPHQW